jgi:hypothetical protein
MSEAIELETKEDRRTASNAGLGDNALPEIFTTVYSIDEPISWGEPTTRTLLDANEKLTILNNSLMARIEALERRANDD